MYLYCKYSLNILEHQARCWIGRLAPFGIFWFQLQWSHNRSPRCAAIPEAAVIFPHAFSVPTFASTAGRARLLYLAPAKFAFLAVSAGHVVNLWSSYEHPVHQLLGQLQHRPGCNNLNPKNWHSGCSGWLRWGHGSIKTRFRYGRHATTGKF